jgi:hypothetical protein
VNVCPYDESVTRNNSGDGRDDTVRARSNFSWEAPQIQHVEENDSGVVSAMEALSIYFPYDLKRVASTTIAAIDDQLGSKRRAAKDSNNIERSSKLSWPAVGDKMSSPPVPV